MDDLSAIPRALRGMHPDNPVNRPRHGGVQLELPPRVRGLGPYWDKRPHEPRPTAALVEALGSVAEAWLYAPDNEASTSDVRARSSGVPNSAPVKSVAPPSAMRPI